MQLTVNKLYFTESTGGYRIGSSSLFVNSFYLNCTGSATKKRITGVRVFTLKLQVLDRMELLASFLDNREIEL